MKKIRLIAAMCLVALALAACGKPTDTPSPENPTPTASTNPGQVTDTPENKTKFAFSYNNVKITPNDYTKALVKAINADYEYLESPSCAYVGLDKCYIYKDFTIYTYPDSKAEDHVLEIELTTDSISTPEGLKIGDTSDKAKEIYGSNYRDINGSLEYTALDTALQVLVKDGKIVSIQYWYLDPTQTK